MPIFPIHDGRELTHVARPYATWAIILVNVAVYFVFEGGLGGDVSFAAVYGFGLIPATYNDYFELPPDILAVPDWLTLVTYAFLHADFWHLLGNMVFLWVFADNIEATIGSVRFFLFYFLGGLAAHAAHIYFNWYSTVPTIGASGAIAAVMGAYLVMFPTSRIKVWFFFLIFRMPAIFFLGIWIAMQWMSGTASLEVNTAQSGGTAWWAHIGGFAFGVLAGFYFRFQYPSPREEQAYDYYSGGGYY